MRIADVFVHDTHAGVLIEKEPERSYAFIYASGYSGEPISLTMPLRSEPYCFTTFPPFFDGLLPEGWQLDALLKKRKLDKKDLFGQLLTVGRNCIGAVSIHERLP